MQIDSSLKPNHGVANITLPRISSPNVPVREDWLNMWHESPIEPELPIVDAHHHLWDREHSRYLLLDYLADIASGHQITRTVYVQCRSMYRVDTPEKFRPVGEVEFARGVAAQSASGHYGTVRVCDAIIGCADLTLGPAVAEVLDSLQEAGGDRLKGIRYPVAFHPDSAIRSGPVAAPAGLLTDENFNRGVSELAGRDLSLDVWAYQTQLPEVARLAGRHPNLTVVIDHLGGPLGIGDYRKHSSETFDHWSASIADLAKLDNTRLKIGGLGMRVAGFDFHTQANPPDSGKLADAWRPWVEFAIESFGAERCMFESNFPVDKGMYSYASFWNACKKLTKTMSAFERGRLFSETATSVYGL